MDGDRILSMDKISAIGLLVAEMCRRKVWGGQNGSWSSKAKMLAVRVEKKTFHSFN